MFTPMNDVRQAKVIILGIIFFKVCYMYAVKLENLHKKSPPHPFSQHSEKQIEPAHAKWKT